MRLRSDIWIAGYLRRVMVAGAFVAVRRKGVPEGGTIFLRIDHLDGNNQLFGPPPPSSSDEDTGGRAFSRVHAGDTIDNAAVEARLAREIKFDPDLWIVEVEDRKQRTFLEDDEVRSPN